MTMERTIKAAAFSRVKEADPVKNASETMQIEKVSLAFLFLHFLKIGAISWGGFMALIAVVQKEFVDKKKLVRDDVVIDGISLASVLPGPVAFNVIAYLGYHLRGIRGALVSMTGILLPSFLLILGLAYVYTTYDQIPEINQFFRGVLPAVSAVIVSVALNMAKKQIAGYRQVMICVSAGIVLLLVRSYFATLGVIAVAGLAGYFLYNRKGEEPERKLVEQPAFSWLRTGILVAIPVALILTVYLVSLVFVAEGTILRQMALTFSGLSLTLFGGGYVIIPAMQQVLVDGLHWLTVQEFADAIAMGQITPGPIFISATFIGYKMAGIAGAIVGTVAIFFPPGFIMVFCSRFLDPIRKSAAIVAAFKGLRPAIIGMIFSAAVTIMKGMDLSIQAGLIFLLILLLTIRFKVNVVYLIPASGIIGILVF